MKNLLFITVTCLLLSAANGLAQQYHPAVSEEEMFIMGNAPIVVPHSVREATEEEIAALRELGADAIIIDGNTFRITLHNFTTVDHSEMYLSPPFGAPTDWISPPPLTPEELLREQQMEAMYQQMEDAAMRAPMRGIARAIWNGQGANLMPFIGAMEYPEIVDTWGISQEQFQQIEQRIMSTTEQMTVPMEVAMFSLMEEMETAMSGDWETDMETKMRMQTEMTGFMENAMETMGTMMNTAIADAFDEFLTPEQLRMIQESQLANIEELPVFSPSIFEALDLTDAQREQMEQIKRELEPDFEATLDSWVDGFIATQRMVDEEWIRERVVQGHVITRVDDEGNFSVAVFYPGSDYFCEDEWIAMESEECLAEFLNDFTLQAISPSISHDDIRKRLLAEDQMFRQIHDEMQSKGRAFAERFKIEMFDVLTDEQWARLQELIDHPPEHALALRKALREMLGMSEASESEASAAASTDAGGRWIPGPGSWRPGDATPVRIQEQRESRFPRGE